MKTIRTLFLSFLLLMAASCDSSEKTADEAIAEGWDAFEIGNYEEAITSFEEAIDIDVNSIEAHVGKTYAHALLSQFGLAISAAEAGLDVDASALDIYAALGLIHNARESFIESNTNIQEVLDNESNWAFTLGGLSLNADNLNVTKAQNFYNLNDFENSLLAIQAVNAAFNADVTTAAGQAALLVEIGDENISIFFN